MKSSYRLLVVFYSGIVLLGPMLIGTISFPPEAQQEYDNGVVVSVSAPGSEAGLSILLDGGNAVDAAVATAFAMVAAYPQAGNLGGGGFMLVHPAPGQGSPVVFDYRETAPAAAARTMFTKKDSQYAHKAVATPGTVRGLAMVHHRLGKLPWSRILRPAVALARDGFLIDANLAKSLNRYLADTLTLPNVDELAEFERVFSKPGGGLWKAGDRLVQPDLARTLQRLADEGPDAFYKGFIAGQIVAEMKRGKGLITAGDLAGYHAIARQPLTTRYRGRYDVYTPPAPSSGGVGLIEMLNIVNAFDLQRWGRWSPTTLHVMAEAMRRAGCDRARFLGDPAFVRIPPYLTTPAYGLKLARTINLDKATPSAALAPDILLAPEEHSTTHFSVIDRDGMAVSSTYTLERKWGSRVVVKGAGFLLNNEMFGFTVFPGPTTRQGVIGTEPNTIAAGKKMLSSQTPTIVAENGRVRLVTGTPGSLAIPNTVLCILVNVLDFDMPLHQAVAAPRLSQEWFPDEISFEDALHYQGAMTALAKMGHRIVYAPQGDAHTIWVNPQTNHYVGVADWRISGGVAGY